MTALSNTLCKKCGIGRMYGPTYCPGNCSNFGQDKTETAEHLHYRCMTCGYVAHTPTVDGARARSGNSPVSPVSPPIP